MLVDGTDFSIPQKGAAKKGNPFGSHKYAGKSALRYKLGVDILMGNLVWIQGPYPAGAWPDIKIFTSCLAHFLEPYEHIKANDGYRGHGDKVKCPKNDVNSVENLKMQGRIRVRHEMPEELGNTFPGLPPQHPAPRGCFLGVRGDHSAHHQAW
jgi:hypothetical protein